MIDTQATFSYLKVTEPNVSDGMGVAGVSQIRSARGLPL